MSKPDGAETRRRTPLAIRLILALGLVVSAPIVSDRPAEAAPPGPRACAEIGGPANAHYSRGPGDRGTTITAEEAIARACDWIGTGLTYSQSGYHPDRHGTLYRRDCSGFVSMAWHADTSYATSTIAPVSHTIPWRELQPGDAVIRRLVRGHIEMVTAVHEDGTVDLVAFGSTPPVEKRHHITVLMGDYEEAIRYNHMENLTDDMVREAIIEGLPDLAPSIEPGGRTLVQFPTNFYVDGRPFVDEVELVGLTVQIRAEQTDYRWHFDDGSPEDPRDTTFPGGPYPGDDLVLHRYRTVDEFEPSVDVTWGAFAYRVITDDDPDPDWTEIDGTHTVNGPTAQIQTLESITRLVAPR